MRKIFFVTLVCSFLVSSTAMAVSFSADSITPMMGAQSPVRGKLYFEDKNTYRSDAMGIVSIVKDSFVYSLVTDTKKYTVQSLAEMRKQSPAGVWGDAAEMIDSREMKKVGKENLQGYQCIIYEGDFSFADDTPPMHIKLWYSKKLKNMLKQEMSLPSPMGQITSHLENIKVGKQDNHLFEIPPDYVKVSDMSEAMGFGNFTMPGQGEGNNQMPSEEDMKKMMEQMQNMMKNLKPQ